MILRTRKKGNKEDPGPKEKGSWIWTTAYTFFILVFTIYALLDTFVLTRAYSAQTDPVESTAYVMEEDQEESAESTGDSGTLSFDEYEVEGTQVYAAVISLDEITDLKAYMAENT